ncbi:response regulator [Oceanobacillus halophilus]|uniref:Response regulator n=1 Tax=Oceanobacillus halophilus TaxID=930130 RepID=A0A495A7U9_9BACI|nr:response regulator [Oceanobacillus halophilus]RKQ35799.1 response regulator [Oceanobacillus halophilus]
MIHVLIVEDDPMVLEVNKSFLEKIPHFHLMGSAGTGKEAIEMIRRKDPDLVLLDVFLPDLSGLDVIQKVREEGLPVDIIMITAARDTNTVHQFFRFGAVDYIVKPFRFDRFKIALNNYWKMWNKLQWAQSVSQKDIDEWTKKQEIRRDDDLPKGLSENTLKQVLIALYEQKEPVTSEQLAEYLGMARVTVRRYLDYLSKQKKITVKMEYGKVGRPSNFYLA